MEKKLRNAKRAKQQARQRRVARKVADSRRPRLTIYRTARHIYAQLVDADTGRTVAGVSTRSKSISQGLPGTGNVEAAKRVGAAIAELAKEKQIEAVVFNRNGFLYHGRVKALAEAAREAGLRF
jgi:large subunit ribosomal protein L18